MIAVPPALVERVLPVLLESDRAPPDDDKNAALPLLGPVSVGTVAPRGAEEVEEEADEVEWEGEVEGLKCGRCNLLESKVGATGDVDDALSFEYDEEACK